MNTNVTTTTTPTVPQAASTGVYAGPETSEVDHDRGSDLSASQRVHATAQADRIEISDVGKALAKLSDQASDKPELQLSPEKLQEMASE